MPRFLNSIFRSWPFWLVAVLLSFAVAGLFSGHGSMYFGPADSDLVNTFYPWQVFVSRWFNRGVFPFWDPHAFNGYPTLESQQMLALNPVHLFSLIALPPSIAMAFQMAAGLVLAFLGMIFAMRKASRAGWGASAIAAGGFVFGALFTTRIIAGHFTVVAAIAWWPWALGFCAIIMRRMSEAERGRALEWRPWRKTFWKTLPSHLAGDLGITQKVVVALSFVHALVLLAGGPQYVVYLGWLEIVTVLAFGAARLFIRGILLTGIAWILGLMISAPQWLPMLAGYLHWSARGASSPYGSVLTGSIDLIDVGLELLLPYPFGDDMSRPHLHFKNVWETATYPGTIILGLAISTIISFVWFAVRRKKRSDSKAQKQITLNPAELIGISGIFLAIYMMLGLWLPGFSGFRDPLKARAVLSIALAFAAGGAWQRITENREPRLQNLQIFLGGFGVVLLACGWGLRLLNPQKFTDLLTLFRPPFDPQDQAAYLAVMNDPTAAIGAYGHGLTVVLCIAAAACVLAGTAWVFRKRPLIVRCIYALVLLAALTEPFWLARNMLVATHPYTKIGIPASLQQLADNTIKKRGPHEAPFRFYLSPQIINRTHFMDDFLECRGYDPLMPLNGASRVLLLDPKQINHNLTTASVFRMRAVGVRYDISDWEPKSRDPIGSTYFKPTETTSTIVTMERRVAAGFPDETGFGPDYANTNYVVPPKWGGQVVAASDLPPEFVNRVSDIKPLADGPSDGCGPAPGERVEWNDTGRPDTREVKLILRSPALLVLHETWLPGWTMQIDFAEPHPALCANKWMVAAKVDAGTHIVTFAYRPLRWDDSWIVAGIGLFLCLVLFTARSRSFVVAPMISTDWVPKNDPWR